MKKLRRQLKKDLGVDNLSPKKQTNRIIGNVYELLRNIKVAFTCINEDMIKKPITTLKCPKFEYTITLWSMNKRNP